MKNQYKFKFIIKHGMYGVQCEVIEYTTDLFKLINNLCNHYFRMEIVQCFRVVGSTEVEIKQLRGVRTLSNISLIRQIARNDNKERLKEALKIKK